MAVDPDAIEAVTVDSYSTLLDVEAAAEALSGLADDPESVYRTWRTRSLAYATQSNLLGNYRPFYELNRLALEYALALEGVESTPQEREAALEVYHDLPVFEDVPPGMERLQAAGYDLYVLSNGDPEMLDSLVERAGIGGLIEDTISADEVETYKPAAELYRHAARRVGVRPERIIHASAGLSDVAGGMNVGTSGAWVNRTGRPRQRFYPDPDVVVDDLRGLADALGA